MIHFLLINFGAVLIYMTCWYGVGLIYKRNDVADIAWGLGFVVASLVSMVQVAQVEGSLSWRTYMILAAVALWAVRLSTYIFLRNRGKGEDFRYATWRKEWGKNGVWRSYLQIFVLQGVLLTLVGLPVWWMIATNDSSPIGLLDVIGICIFLKGLTFEAVADAQMMKFRKDRSPGQVMNTGLWRYSRHPNYYGESMVWWGIFTIALSSRIPLWTAVSPLLMTFLLVRVSGVPMLEKKYNKNKEYRKYQETTSSFIPWFPKKQK